MNNLLMELKVCEGCGGLWLRTGAKAGVYCHRCAGRLAELPAAKGRKTLYKPRVKRLAPAETNVVAGVGGAA